MNEDVKWILGLIILFGIFFFASGSLGGMANKKPFLNGTLQTSDTAGDSDFTRIGNNSDNTPYYSSGASRTQAQTPIRRLTVREEIEQTLKDVGVQASEIAKQLEALEEANRASPLSGKLSIATKSSGGKIAGEYVIVKASPRNSEKVLLSGLRLQSSVTGNGANIPKAVPLFFQNQINKEEPVYLGAGESAYIITARSPLGVSFRPNICTGFFNQYQKFNPTLPSRCPRPRDEDLPFPYTVYFEPCRDYINSLPACRVILSPPKTLSPECERYVTTEINYPKCVEKHKNDANFYDLSWRIYLGRDESLWRSKRELMYLLDQNGKVIDAITY